MKPLPTDIQSQLDALKAQTKPRPRRGAILVLNNLYTSLTDKSSVLTQSEAETHEAEVRQWAHDHGYRITKVIDNRASGF